MGCLSSSDIKSENRYAVPWQAICERPDSDLNLGWWQSLSHFKESLDLDQVVCMQKEARTAAQRDNQLVFVSSAFLLVLGILCDLGACSINFQTSQLQCRLYATL